MNYDVLEAFKIIFMMAITTIACAATVVAQVILGVGELVVEFAKFLWERIGFVIAGFIIVIIVHIATNNNGYNGIVNTKDMQGVLICNEAIVLNSYYTDSDKVMRARLEELLEARHDPRCSPYGVYK